MVCKNIFAFVLIFQQIDSFYSINTIQFINDINNAQTDWVAEENDYLKKDESEIKKLLGLKLKHKEDLQFDYSYHEIVLPEKIPDHFDSREKWPSCVSIRSIKDQSNCGSCWAVSTASAMSDRLCIASQHKVRVNISAEALMTCCYQCTSGYPGCEGGYIDEPWKYFKKHGLVTGGDYGSNEGCQPYGIAPCHHCKEEAETPKCRKKSCTNKHYKKKYRKDLHKGKSFYALPNNETLIKADILLNGPAVTGFVVYRDFMYYKKGVYKHTGGPFMGNHAVRVLGWGIEKKTPYWLVANSWNTTWGDHGLFKIRRGVNECTFEGNFYAGIPKPK